MRLDRVTLIKVIVLGLMLIALSLSVSHIVALGAMWGLTVAERWVAPLFVDMVFLLGKLMRHDSFAPDARKIGAWMMGIGGALSLTANALAGHTTGQRVFGVMICLGFMGGEYALSKIQRSATVNRQAAARKAAATRAANKAAAPAKPKPAPAAAKKAATPAKRAPRKPTTPKITVVAPAAGYGTAAAYV